MQHFYILSGGPGSGKTALIQALAKQGMHRIDAEYYGKIKLPHLF